VLLGPYNDQDLREVISQFKPKAYWFPLSIVAILLFAVLSFFTVGMEATAIIGGGGVSIGFALVALETLRSLGQVEDSSIQRSWTFFGVGVALWSLASGVQALLGVFQPTALRTPSFVNLLQLAGSLAIFAGLSSYTASLDKSFGRIRIVLDIILLSVGTITFFWLIFYRSILLIGLADPIPAFWVHVQGALELIFLILIIRLFTLSRNSFELSAFVGLGSGTLVLIFADLIEGYQHLQGLNHNAALFAAFRMLASLFLLYGIRVYQGKDRTLVEEKSRSPIRIRGRPIELILPIAITYVVVGFLFLDWWIAGEIDTFAFRAIVVMAVLLVARQGVIIGQSELRRYAELVNATADLAFICDQNGEIILANPSLREVLETSTLEDPLPNLSEILKASISLDALLSIASVSGWVGEVTFERSDGSPTPASLSLIPIQDERENRLLFAATAHDLTTVKLREDDLKNALGKLADAQKELQSMNIELERKVEARTQELKEMVAHLAQLNEELKALDEMKTEFVALVSHELRAPLTNIQTGLEVVLDSADETETAESLELIMAETSRLGGFVETILDLSALEAGRFPIQLRSLSLQEIVHDVCRKFKKQSVGERILLNVSADTPYVVADDQGVRSVLYHLLDNAIKYAPEGDIHLNAITQDDHVTISISDSGPGIPEEEREKVFEMFYRMDSRDSRAVYGRGLGLNLARRFLDVMDGGIEIADSKPKGTEVRFWLPKDKHNRE
jgi:signal transduction histidine kinase